jgi:hypothetical protein
LKTITIKVEIVGVDCNVSPTLLRKEKRLKTLYWRSPTLLREVKRGELHAIYRDLKFLVSTHQKQ